MGIGQECRSLVKLEMDVVCGSGAVGKCRGTAEV